MPLNLTKLFHNSTQPAFLQNITPDSKEVAELRKAKDDILKYLKAAIPRWLEEKHGEKPEDPPRFRTQGSWAYHTCNDPCQHPPQEMDWDLGIYLPISLWEDNGIKPKRAAKDFYGMVKTLMEPLAQERGWDITEKPTCVRVLLNNGIRAHIDLPLYAAPDKDFIHIKEAAVAKVASETYGKVATREQQWASLTQISLACQDGSWNTSDPGLVVLWFKSKITRHGDQLRRISRYLKAWRDYTWDTGGPSSILLMVCAAQTLDQAAGNFEGRDDLALLEVLKALPEQLRNAVTEPMINADEDLNRLSVEDKSLAAQHSEKFLQDLSRALNTPLANCTVAVDLLQNHFGGRLPLQPDLISSAPVDIRDVLPSKGQEPNIAPTKAG